MNGINPDQIPLQCICRGRYFTKVHSYEQPPAGEIKFDFSSSGKYHRQLWRCELCGHFLSVHGMDTSRLYEGDYVSSNYSDEEGLRRTFEKIISLSPSKSDNTGRVRRVIEYAENHFREKTGRPKPSVLDVGSGLCVFLHEMKKAGWNCTALDPDLRACRHAELTVGVRAICADFRKVDLPEKYDVLTFNRVLEHVLDPVGMLAKAKEYLELDGFIYLELPDGEIAFQEGPEREEFTIDHVHIFSMCSLTLLVHRAGLTLNLASRLREPSGKYTLFAFLKTRSENV